MRNVIIKKKKRSCESNGEKEAWERNTLLTSPSFWISLVLLRWKEFQVFRHPEYRTTAQVNFQQEEKNDHSTANALRHFCDLVGCLHDVFKCVIVVFCIGNIAFLNEQSYTVGYTPSNKIFTLEALNMQRCAFCLMTND